MDGGTAAEKALAASGETSGFRNFVDAYPVALAAGQGPSEIVQETVEDTSAAVDTENCTC